MRCRPDQHGVASIRTAEFDQKHLDQMRDLKVFVPSLSDQLVLATQKVRGRLRKHGGNKGRSLRFSHDSPRPISTLRTD